MVPQAPFMEHPTGRFDRAVAAMADAVARLRAIPTWDRWITFTAQGAGHRPDSFRCAEVRLLGSTLASDAPPIDLPLILEVARVGSTALVTQGTQYSVAHASPEQAARILDAIFRHHLGIQPFPDEDDDYAVGAEW